MPPTRPVQTIYFEEMLFYCLFVVKNQRIIDISLRAKQLDSLFSYDKKTELKESHPEIIPLRFTQTRGVSEIDEFQKGLTPTGFYPITDDRIQENKSFSYAISTPSGCKKNNEAIILLHGLNERTWEKYLTWTECLTHMTGKPVTLFPTAFHTNRTPGLWANPRTILPQAGKHKEEIANVTNSTFVNVALSSRLSQNPLRLCASGRKSVYNMWQLVHEIESGEYPLFKEDTSINLFAYSIGALFLQVPLLANPDKMFTDIRLFMFRDDSIFSGMDGNVRGITDREVFAKVRHYFRYDSLENCTLPTSFKNDFLEQALKATVREDVLRDYRKLFFQRACDRIRAISLKKDIVMPTGGVIKALGKAPGKILGELDSLFAYSHQTPFPTHSRIDPGLINQVFHSIFTRAAAFL